MNYRLLTLSLLAGLAMTSMASAQAMSLNGSVTLSPSKIELTANPGQHLRREFTITSQSPEDLRISLRFENLTEGDAPKYPLTPYLSTAERAFILPAEGRVTVPIIINLPNDIPPGGFYGTALFSITSPTEATTGGKARVVTQLAPLIFLRVKGEVVESGSLIDVKFIDRTFYLTYENTGNIYLNPYGTITVRNKLTKTESATLQVDPWFVLPGAMRIREVNLPESLSTGWYEANVKLNNGYAESVSEKTINFFVITPKILALIILIIVGLLLLVL